MEMKMTLSTPSTISRTVSVSRAMRSSGEVRISIGSVLLRCCAVVLLCCCAVVLLCCCAVVQNVRTGLSGQLAEHVSTSARMIVRSASAHEHLQLGPAGVLEVLET